MYRQRIVIALFLLLTLVTACAPKAALKGFDRAGRESMVQPGAPMATTVPAPMEKPAGELYGGADAGSRGQAVELMIIRTANMTIIVQDTDQTLEAMRRLTADHKGYVSNSNRWLVGNQPYARVTIRVPAESLDAVLATIRKLAIKVQEENISSQDVTEEYVDLKARLVNLEAAEEELRALLTEVRENRGKAEDILAIYRQLTEIRSQIESLKGRMQFLEQMTAMATLNLEIRPVEAPQPIVDRPRWNPLVTISGALRAFVQVLQVLVDLLIYLAVFSPFVLVPLLILWVLVRWIRRRQRNRKRQGESQTSA
ncbi:MAG: DUF4349 domain-containing protein [Chloroflexi bacterium]|nr:DUF4349 domain-containing protein [Chloroflexota bacterium]